MSSLLANKRIRKNFPSLPDVILPDDPEEDPKNFQDPKIVIENAEARAQQSLRQHPKASIKGNDRVLAEELHKEADQLHYRGDYEAALVLYHRAANICPRDTSHSDAARRTEMAINAATNPPGGLKKVLPLARNAAQLSTNFCSESAAIRAKSILKESTDPLAEIPQILKFIDARERIWRSSSTSSTPKLTPSQKILHDATKNAKSTLKNLEKAYNSGDIKATLERASELLQFVLPLENPYRYQVYAYHYIALAQVSINRHDHAVDSVAKMVYVAKLSEDSGLRSMSFVTVGKVHLGFGHLNAAARAWLHLSHDILEPIPKAWILHEIGRCYLEMGHYKRALEMSLQCLEKAEKANSKKWMLHAKLLNGQSLLKLGRYGEAMTALKVAEKITKDEGDSPTLSYIQNLMEDVGRTLSQAFESLQSTTDILGDMKYVKSDESRSPKMGLTYRL